MPKRLRSTLTKFFPGTFRGFLRRAAQRMHEMLEFVIRQNLRLDPLSPSRKTPFHVPGSLYFDDNIPGSHLPHSLKPSTKNGFYFQTLQHHSISVAIANLFNTGFLKFSCSWMVSPNFVYRGIAKPDCSGWKKLSNRFLILRKWFRELEGLAKVGREEL